MIDRNQVKIGRQRARVAYKIAGLNSRDVWIDNRHHGASVKVGAIPWNSVVHVILAGLCDSVRVSGSGNIRYLFVCTPVNPKLKDVPSSVVRRMAIERHMKAAKEWDAKYGNVSPFYRGPVLYFGGDWT